MKDFFNSKFIVAGVSLIIGAASMWGYQKLMHSERPNKPVQSVPRNSDDFFNDFFNEDFFGRSRDPFEEMRRMQKRMFKQFEGQEDFFPDRFNNWYSRKFGGNIGEISQREDADNIYYEIDLKGMEPKELKVDVKGGQVSVRGQVEQKKEENGSSSSYSSEFMRSFPVPPGVESEKFKMEQKDGKVVITFPKKKSE